MAREVNRGYCPTDRRDFGAECLPLLQAAQRDIAYLVNRGYDLERAVTFVGNRFQFSAQQRTALTRAICTAAALEHRRARLVTENVSGEAVHIDGFNLIITLEAALSPQTTLLRCMDSTVRDLCGLHGTYRVIASTQTALAWIAAALLERQAGAAIFYLDAPVSNSGRLREVIWEAMARAGLPCEVHLVPNADAELWGKERAVTSDGMVLDRCESWLNLTADIIGAQLPGRRLVDLSCEK